MSGHVVIAPDKFKGTLTAPQVAERVAAGLRRARPGLPIECLPIADGGDGTVEAAVAAGFSRREATVAGPAGDRIRAAYAARGEAAVVELAEASGLRRIPARAPLIASSFGTGELVAAAIDGGATRIVLGLGGSACTDGGAGLAAALGVRLLDARGRALPLGGAALGDLDSIDLGDLPARLGGVTVVVASDVDSPLLGPDGAARVYGPQKGATPSDVRLLEDGLARLAEIVRRDLGLDLAARPGAGAAGGVGFGAMAFLNATLEPGIAYLLDLLRFPEHAEGARLVITGEGSLDRQTLRGKAPAGVARAAARSGVPVIALAGRRALGREEVRDAGFAAAYALTDVEPDVEKCMADPGPLLERLAERVAEDWLR